MLAKRIAARSIDCWLLGLTLAALWGLGFRFAADGCNGVSRCYGFAGIGIALLVGTFGILAAILCEGISVAFFGKTIGKALLGLRVARPDGSQPPARQSLARASLFWLSLPVSGVAGLVPYGILATALGISVPGGNQLALLVLLSPLWLTGVNIVLLTSGKTPLHDLLAGTQVVRESERGVRPASRKGRWSRTAKVAGAALLAATAIGVAAPIWAYVETHPRELTASERQSYVQDNERLLDSLPQIPGSQRVNLQSLPYCTNGTIIGYSTYADYKTPTQMSHEEIVDFYVQRLGDGWQHTVTNESVMLPRGATDTITGAEFKRDSSRVFVSVGPVPPGSSYSYSVSLDSRRAGSHSCHED